MRIKSTHYRDELRRAAREVRCFNHHGYLIGAGTAAAWVAQIALSQETETASKDEHR